MRAVNLIPADERRGAGGIAGRSGGLVYVVTGGLLVVVMLGVVYAFAVKDVAKKTGQLNQVTREVALVTAQANSLQPYTQVHALSEGKLQSVVSIAESRFNWPGAMAQIALALPSDVTFNSLTAVASNASSAGTAAVPSTTTSAGSPTFALSGCASSQSEIATILTRLESVPSVTNVSLADSAKQADSAPNTRNGTVSRSSAASQSGRCPFVSWTMNLEYSGSYTVPNSKLGKSSASASTTSHSNSSTSSSGVVAGSQVAR
jgi:Tfp pilus assembly protein PilN